MVKCSCYLLHTQVDTMTLWLKEPLTYDQHRNDLKQQYQNISLESLTNGRGSRVWVGSREFSHLPHTTRDPRPATICTMYNRL